MTKIFRNKRGQVETFDVYLPIILFMIVCLVFLLLIFFFFQVNEVMIGKNKLDENLQTNYDNSLVNINHASSNNEADLIMLGFLNSNFPYIECLDMDCKNNKTLDYNISLYEIFENNLENIYHSDISNLLINYNKNKGYKFVEFSSYSHDSKIINLYTLSYDTLQTCGNSQNGVYKDEYLPQFSNKGTANWKYETAVFVNFGINKLKLCKASVEYTKQ